MTRALQSRARVSLFEFRLLQIRDRFGPFRLGLAKGRLVERRRQLKQGAPAQIGSVQAQGGRKTRNIVNSEVPSSGFDHADEFSARHAERTTEFQLARGLTLPAARE